MPGDYLHDFTSLCSHKDSLQEILGRSAVNDDSGLMLLLFVVFLPTTLQSVPQNCLNAVFYCFRNT